MRIDVVMFEDIAMAGMKTQAVDDAGMAFGVIDNDIMTTTNAVNGAHYTLIAVIEKGGVFFA